MTTVEERWQALVSSIPRGTPGRCARCDEAVELRSKCEQIENGYRVDGEWNVRRFPFRWYDAGTNTKHECKERS